MSKKSLGKAIEEFGEKLPSAIVQANERSEGGDLPEQLYEPLMESLLRFKNKMASQEFLESSNSEVIQTIEMTLRSCLEKVETWNRLIESIAFDRLGIKSVASHKRLIIQKLKEMHDNISEHSL